MTELDSQQDLRLKCAAIAFSGYAAKGGKREPLFQLTSELVEYVTSGALPSQGPPPNTTVSTDSY